MRIASELTLLAGLAAAPILLSISLAQSATPTMKAIVVHEYGGPEVLKYQDAPRPAPKEDQILVRVIAAGVNPVDDASRSEKYAKFFGITLPFIPGYDIAGVVEKTGANITKFKAGDSVYVYLSLKDGGGYAEYAVASEVEAAQKPKSISFVEAAAVPVVALTAWQALIDCFSNVPAFGSGECAGASCHWSHPWKDCSESRRGTEVATSHSPVV